MRYCRPGDGWEAVKHLPGTLHYNCFSLSLSLLKEVVELVLPSLCSVHSPLLAGFQPFSRLTWVGRDFDPQNCHDAMMQSELGKLPTVNQPPPAHTISDGTKQLSSLWIEKFYRHIFYYLWQHLVLLRQRPIIGDQQAQRNDSVRRYYLPDDSRHFISPRGFLATRLFSSIPVEEGGVDSLLCNRSKHCSGYYKIPFPSTAHSFIKSSRHGSKICVPSFMLIPISPSSPM